MPRSQAATSVAQPASVGIPARANTVAQHSPLDQPRRSLMNWPAIVIITALHGAGLYGLLQIESVRKTITEAAPLVVSFLPTPPAAKPDLPPPKPQPPRPRHEPHLVSTPAPSPAAVQTLPPDPQPEPAPVVDPAPSVPPAPAVPPNFVAAYLDNPAPAYPAVSRRLGESGEVLLRVHVDAGGRGETIELSKSSGFDRLDQAAIDAVRRWRFVSARQGEQAIAAWVLIPIHFQLDH